MRKLPGVWPARNLSAGSSYDFYTNCAKAGHKSVPDTYDDTSPNACPSIRSLARDRTFRIAKRLSYERAYEGPVSVLP
ncbi:hypothetical protein [Paenibacillus sp. GCM10012306]|uniref:hypothetical protein n=1 Tax=Paenibacillus sp. GCM10012306 TaxID=3317342 RepID=UPI0036D3412D